MEITQTALWMSSLGNAKRVFNHKARPVLPSSQTNEAKEFLPSLLQQPNLLLQKTPHQAA